MVTTLKQHVEGHTFPTSVSELLSFKQVNVAESEGHAQMESWSTFKFVSKTP